ncbi:MAG: cyclase family protein [Candidatus Bathyarchaeia archaeon]
MVKIKSVIDLSHPIYHNCPGWPGFPLVNISRLKILPRDGCNVELINSYNTHTGTHIDAPLHQIEGGKSIDEIPLEELIGEGVVFDLSYKKEGESTSSSDLEKHSSILNEKDIVLLFFNWSRYRDFNRKYLYDYPYLDASGARWLIKKRVRVVGCDTLSIAHPKDEEVHKILLSNNVWIIEELNNLDRLKNNRWFLCFLPINFKGCGGAPCRAVAMIFE